MNGGASVADLRAASSISVTRRSPTGVAQEAAAPANPYYRAEFHFMPGWIALRFYRIRSRLFSISRKWTKAQAIQLCWRARLIGAAVRSRPPDNSMR